MTTDAITVEHGDLPEWAEKAHRTLMELLRFYQGKQHEAMLRGVEARRRGYRSVESEQTAECVQRYIDAVVRDLARLEVWRPVRVIVQRA